MSEFFFSDLFFSNVLLSLSCRLFVGENEEKKNNSVDLNFSFLSIILGKVRMDRGASGSQRQAGKKLDRFNNYEHIFFFNEMNWLLGVNEANFLLFVCPISKGWTVLVILNIFFLLQNELAFDYFSYCTTVGRLRRGLLHLQALAQGQEGQMVHPQSGK